MAGRACFEAILRRDPAALGAALNDCMLCWEALLPQTIRHPTIHADLMGILSEYQSRYRGAMYSGCAGGYLIVVSETPVADGMRIKIRI